MAEHDTGNTPSPEQSTNIHRRNILRWGALIGGSALGGIALSLAGREIFSGDATDRLEGGKIIDEQALIARLTHAHETLQPVTPDPTILKTTLQLVMRHHGTPYGISQGATEHIYLDELKKTDGQAGLRENSLRITLGTHNFDNPGSAEPKKSWSSLIHLIGHEGTHISTIPDTTATETEDYGPLGTAKKSQGIWGFTANNDSFDGPFNLIRPTLSFGDLPQALEEWVAEAGRINFIRHLRDAGLGGDYVKDVAESRLSCRCHAFLEPSIRQAYEPDSNTPFGPVFSPEWLLTQHCNRNRADTFLRMGQGLYEQNPASTKHNLPPATIRGLGMLGFSAFVHEQGSDTPRTLQALTTAALDDTEIVDLAKRHHAFLERAYKK